MPDDTTDWAEFKRQPADERDRLGFAEYRRQSRIGTHGPGCWQWGHTHQQCALHEIDQLRDTLVAIQRSTDFQHARALAEVALTGKHWTEAKHG